MRTDIIIRNPETASRGKYDLIVIGGGIYGAMLAMESARRDLKVLLLEKADFGWATSFNSLRIIHGGFRYLQSLDLKRFFESVNERKWFLKNFPAMVTPLPCLMPLYGEGLRRNSVLKAATKLNNILSSRRNNDIDESMQLPDGRVLTPGDTIEIAPSVRKEGLKGGVVWYDACMPDSQFIIMSILRWASEHGAVLLNYMEATELIKSGSATSGIRAHDKVSGDSFEFIAPVIINAAGPWCRKISTMFDNDRPELFSDSIAWNLFIDKKIDSSHALAITPKGNKARTYFLYPWKGKVIAGTGHAPWDSETDHARPSENMISEVISDLNQAMPSLDLNKDDLIHILSGLLPAKNEGTSELAVREIIYSHEKNGGPQGMYSVSGVKFTTSRLVAEKTINKIFGDRFISKTDFSSALFRESLENRKFDYNWTLENKPHDWDINMANIIRNESVIHLSDIIFRRTNMWENPDRLVSCARELCKLFPWDNSRKEAEIEKLKSDAGILAN